MMSQPSSCLGVRGGPSIKGGDTIGPNPTNRGKPGTKRHIVVDRGGLPLALTLTGANCHDGKALIEVVDAIQPIRQRRGRPRKRPAKLHADKGYDFGRCRRDLRARGITPRMARRGVESSKHLGKHRWVVPYADAQQRLGCLHSTQLTPHHPG